MSAKLRTHIRSNIIGYVALFFALSTGSAVALSGSNTVFTDDIVNDQVYSADVRNDTLSGGGLAAADLKPASVGTSEVAADSLGAGDLAPSSVGTSEVVNNSLTGADVTNGSLGTAELAGSIPAAHVTRTADQSSPTSGVMTLDFDLERYDTAAMHDNATNNSRLTAPVNGIYAVTAQVRWANAGTGERQLHLRKNLATLIATDSALNVSDQFQEVTTQVRLQAGDFVEARVYQDSGAALNVTKVDEFSPEFSMTWLAPGP